MISEKAKPSQHFSDLVARSNFEPATAEACETDPIDRAALAPEAEPIVSFPPHRSCDGCPNALRRLPETRVEDPPEVFESLLEPSTQAPPYAPKIPWGWAGLDWSASACDFRRPGLDVLARVIDPSRLTEGLFVNRILPDCACTIALHAAADHDGFNGMMLDDLRQEAELARRRTLPGPVKATRLYEKCPSGLPPWPHVPDHMLKAKMLQVDDRRNVTPDPAVARGLKKSKLPLMRTAQDLFSAFGISKEKR